VADIISTVLDGIQHIETCWAMPPSLPYAVYHDRATRRGADLYNGITEHNITIELYAQKPAEDLEALIEQVIAELGATSKKQMGQVMGALGKATGGNFDKPAAAKIVGAKLA